MSNRFRAIPTQLEDAILIEPTAYEDFRGYFKETYRRSDYADLGIRDDFVQENISWSRKDVVRGLHYDQRLSKLVQVIHGRTYHVIADLREDSPTYRRWQAFILSDQNHRQVYVPRGFANGFLVLSDEVWVHYKQSDYYNPETSRVLAWNDPEIGVKWPVANPILSEQDGGMTSFFQK